MKKKGFTLIEFIVVIAIMAILGALLVPLIFGGGESQDQWETVSYSKDVSTGEEREVVRNKQTGEQKTIVNGVEQ